MPKQKKKSRKAGKRERSLIPQVSEPEPELLPTPTNEEVPEPTLSQDSTCDTAIPPFTNRTQKETKANKCYFIWCWWRESGWMADWPPIDVQQKDKGIQGDWQKDKLWDELGEELGFTGKHKFKFYFLLGPLYCRMFEVIRSICIWMVLVYFKLFVAKLYWSHMACSS